MPWRPFRELVPSCSGGGGKGTGLRGPIRELAASVTEFTAAVQRLHLRFRDQSRGKWTSVEFDGESGSEAQSSWEGKDIKPGLLEECQAPPLFSFPPNFF
jgi:hypothetical protein